MSRYTVFLPAPTLRELQKNVARTWVVEEYVLDIPEEEGPSQESQNHMGFDQEEYHDVQSPRSSPILSVCQRSRTGERESLDNDSMPVFSQNLSKLYEGVVFKEDDLDDVYAFGQTEEISQDSDAYGWSTSMDGPIGSTEGSLAGLSQLAPHEIPPTSSYPAHYDTQGTSMEEESLANITRDSSDASIQRLPTFRIPIQHLSSLKDLMQPRSTHGVSNARKVALLVGLLDVDGPDYIRLKKGADAGKEVALLKLVMGDVDGSICKVIVWRDLAEEWGAALSRGDVVLFQDMLFFGNADGTGSYTASNNAKSTATVCYRTIPLVPEDRHLRPDLRLALFDPAIAKVAQVVRWLQQVGGLSLGT